LKKNEGAKTTMEKHRKRALAETGAFTAMIVAGLWLSLVATAPAVALIAAGIFMFILSFREMHVIEKENNPSDKKFEFVFALLTIMVLAGIVSFAWITAALPIPGSVQIP